MRHWRRLGPALAAVAFAAAGLAALAADAAAQPSIDLAARRFDRKVELNWSSSPEGADPLFGGYNVWRSISPDPPSFLLLRRFQRRYPVTWTYPAPAPQGRRPFSDPDSVVTLVKIQISSRGDSAMSRRYLGIRPFNGFPYFYAVTWFSECLSLLNDTLWVEQPQPEIFPFTRDGEERWGFVSGSDTLEVARIPCRRIDPATNRPDPDTTFVYQATVESEEVLRAYAIDRTRLQDPVFPSATAKVSLGGVAVIPNPYVASAPWEEPGQRKIQFVNLTGEATVRIFTTGGDLVRVLDHPAPGAPPEQGSVDWDLKNADGRVVESGIYIYQVESPGGVVDFQGRLVIVK